VLLGENGVIRKKGGSRAAGQNPFYRKVYSPAAPPGRKTFVRQRHYGDWYGNSSAHNSSLIFLFVWMNEAQTDAFHF